MHQPRPYGLHGTIRSDEDAAAVEAHFRKVRNFAETSNLESFKSVRALPSGDTMVVYSIGGVHKVLVFSQPSPTEWRPEHSGLVHAKIPMLFCGLVDKVLAQPETPILIKTTRDTEKRLAKYPKEVAVQPGAHNLVRFNCRMPPSFSDMGVLSGLAHLFTQYARLHPGWWSGSMASVVQIVAGYGRQKFEDLPDDDVERAQMTLPAHVMEKAIVQMGHSRLPGYFGEAHEDGHILFDFRVSKTHGIGFDNEGAPWLVQISDKGVHAMPLPVVPITTTQAFREYVEENSDEELLWILDKFGGMPSGESFPQEPADFAAWERAGVIIKVCETRQFYNLDPIGRAIGWSFNTSGTEAFNTATGLDGVPFAASFVVRLNLQSAPQRGWLRLGEDFASSGDWKKLDVYISNVLSALGSANSHKRAAILYKMYRTPYLDLLGRVINKVDETEIAYWENLVMEPIAAHSGSCNETARGFIYPGAMSALKIPAPVFDGCISHDILGLYEFDMPEKYPECDTVVLGGYQGDTLKVVKYFRDERQIPREKDGNFENCMFEGEWWEETYSTPLHIACNLYTSDYDPREEVAENYKRTDVSSIDLGYPDRPSLKFGAYFWRDAKIHRSRYYGKTTKVKELVGKSKQAYCYIPFLTRNVLVCGSNATVNQVFYSEGAMRGSVQDPNMYDAWTYDWSFHWAAYDMDTSWMDSPQVLMGDKAAVPPNILWVERPVPDIDLRRSECSWWADNGDWLTDFPIDMTWLKFAGLYPAQALLSNPEPPPPFKQYGIARHLVPSEDEGEALNYLTVDERRHELSKKAASSFHYSYSPDPQTMMVFYEDAVMNSAGKAVYANASDNGGQPGRFKTGYASLATHTKAHYFIGVINE